MVAEHPHQHHNPQHPNHDICPHCVLTNLVAYQVRLEDGELEAPQLFNDHLGSGGENN